MADVKKVARIVVNRDLCIGAATCVVNAPGVFELDGENKAVIKMQGGAKNSGPSERSTLEPGAEDDAVIIEVARSCPTKAITLYDETGAEIPL